MLTVFALAPVVVAVLASLLLPFSVWGQRHLITVAVPYVLLVAVAIDRLSLWPIRTLWILAGVAWISAAGVIGARTPYNVAAWDVLVGQLAGSNAEPNGATIYALNSSAGYVTQYYLKQIGAADRFPSAVIRRSGFTPELPPGAPQKYWQLVLPMTFVPTLEDLPLDHFWIADDGGDDGDAASAWSPGDSARTILQQYGFRVGEGITGTVVVRRGNSRRVELFPVWRGDSP